MNIWGLLGAGVLGAIGTFLVGTTGLLELVRKVFAESRQAAKKQESETQVASALVVREAMSIVEVLSKQVKDQRGEILSLEEQHRRESDALRERIRNLEARVSELETELKTLHGENTWLKAQLYDQQRPARSNAGNAPGTTKNTARSSTPRPRRSRQVPQP